MRLIDADALKAEIQRRRKRYKTLTGVDMAMLIDDAPTVGGWISVKDRLPERKWIDYLVATRILTDRTRGFNIAWLNDDNGVWKSNDEWICDGREIVTHWMPLPKGPEEGEAHD